MRSIVHVKFGTGNSSPAIVTFGRKSSANSKKHTDTHTTSLSRSNRIYPLDKFGVPITLGSIVKVNGNSDFSTCEGTVIVNNVRCRRKCPHNGNTVAIYFDREVADHLLFDHCPHQGDKDTAPTQKNFRQCPRVVCFRPEELEVQPDGFSIGNIAVRLFGEEWCSIVKPEFPLNAMGHTCHIRGCEKFMATMITIVKVGVFLHVAYTCARCHKRFHGTTRKETSFKIPLPGTPSIVPRPVQRHVHTETTMRISTR